MAKKKNKEVRECTVTVPLVLLKEISGMKYDQHKTQAEVLLDAVKHWVAIGGKPNRVLEVERLVVKDLAGDVIQGRVGATDGVVGG